MTDEGWKAGDEGEQFLSRWSRLKREAREPPQAATSAPEPVHQADAPPPELPPVEKLTLESDFRGFLHPKVDEDLRRAALKKLFSEPHFNVMDGLDVYIDDYSQSDPLPAAMLAQLKQAQRILEWAREKPSEAGRTEPAAVELEPKATAEKLVAPDAPEAPIVSADAPGDPSATALKTPSAI